MTTSAAGRPRTLITGASGGLGAEFARIGAREGNDLVLAARGADRLDRLAAELRDRHGVSVDTIVQDLSTPDATEDLCDELDRRELDIDVLINNAGYAMHGDFEFADPSELAAMLRLDVVTLTSLTRRLLPRMVKSGSGRILNVSSTAAYVVGPYMSAYYAAKAYVRSFSEALAEEMRGTGVTVTTLSPSPIRSGFQDRAGLSNAPLLRFVRGNVQDVAEAGYRAMMKGRRTVNPGWPMMMMPFVARLTPVSLQLKLMRWLHGK